MLPVLSGAFPLLSYFKDEIMKTNSRIYFMLWGILGGIIGNLFGAILFFRSGYGLGMKIIAFIFYLPFIFFWVELSGYLFF